MLILTVIKTTELQTLKTGITIPPISCPFFLKTSILEYHAQADHTVTHNQAIIISAHAIN